MSCPLLYCPVPWYEVPKINHYRAVRVLHFATIGFFVSLPQDTEVLTTPGAAGNPSVPVLSPRLGARRTADTKPHIVPIKVPIACCVWYSAEQGTRNPLSTTNERFSSLFGVFCQKRRVPKACCTVLHYHIALLILRCTTMLHYVALCTTVCCTAWYVALCTMDYRYVALYCTTYDMICCTMLHHVALLLICYLVCCTVLCCTYSYVALRMLN